MYFITEEIIDYEKKKHKKVHLFTLVLLQSFINTA